MGITTILCKVGEEPSLHVLNDVSLRTLQEIVGGYIERVALEPHIYAWMNEEGIIWDLPSNRLVDTAIGPIVIKGDFVVMATKANGDHMSLSKEEIDRWLPKLNARVNS